MTTAVAKYYLIDMLARDAGFQSGYYAAAKVLGRSISNLQRKGMTSTESDRVIAAIRSGETGGG